ncbi:MAG TPA: amidase [Streptosporangiaceae bacterium]|jgi:amidase
MTRAADPAAEIAALDATGQAELVRRGEVTAAELTEWGIARIEALNPELNAVITPLFDQARQQVAGGATGPFAGVPYLVKDLVTEVSGTRLCEGSVFLRDNVSSFDAELVVRLRRAGLVIAGKTNTPEFGMVPACEPALTGATRNPWDLSRSTSGSSGGAAAAVASGMVPMAHGSDLGGSLRYPASACGVFGLKPTRARNPLGPEYGDAVSGNAVEHAITRSVRDSAALLDATAGPAGGDPYWAPPPAGRFTGEVGVHPGRLRIGYTPLTADGSPGHPDCVAALEDALALCESLGHHIVEDKLPQITPEVGAAIGTGFAAATAWILGYWIRRLGREPGPGELEPLTRAFWAAGRQVSAGDYLLAVGDTQAYSRRVAAYYQAADLWLTPTLSEPPALLGEITSTEAEPMRALERGGRTVAYSGVIANITGQPAMSVPLWWNAAGLPVGVHFLGRFGDEATLLRIAAQLEQARPWAERVPPVSAVAAT